jgi:hypothetical protein
MIMANTLKINRCNTVTVRRTGSPRLPSDCTANPTSSATSSVCSTLPLVRDENRVVGMIPRRNCVVPSDPVSPTAFCPAVAVAASRFRPAPGWMMLPTARPMASAAVDITRK